MRIIEASSKNFNQVVEETVKLIKKGGVVVYPTDTIYGLIVDSTNERAVKKVLIIKKRKDQKPLPIFIKNIEMAKDIAQIDERQQKFLEKVWPGKVTVVLKRRKDHNLPRVLFGKKKTIGLRIPKYKLVNTLLRKINKPLVGTSANISGKPGSTEIGKILAQFENQKFQPDLVINVGNLKLNKPSVIVDLISPKSKILRTGELSQRELTILK